jgi:hypothetical protein
MLAPAEMARPGLPYREGLGCDSARGAISCPRPGLRGFECYGPHALPRLRRGP